jgi:hypothetical protein
MIEDVNRCAVLLEMLQAYCADLRRHGGTREFVWEETGFVSEKRDGQWQRAVSEALKQEGFAYTATPDGFTIRLP